jgi:hypothetical protein
VRSAMTVGLLAGLALGFAGAFGGVVAFVVVLVVGLGGLLAGGVYEGRIDLTSYLGNRAARERNRS